jgi:arylsulfatase A-like enzyme
MADELDFPKDPEPSVVLRVALLGAATGALAGGIEGLGLTLGVRFPIGALGSLLLVVSTMALDSLLGLGTGVVGGLLAAPWRRMLHWKRVRLGATFTVLLLASFFLAPLARELYLVQERPVPAAGMMALALLVSGTFWFNAGYWLRRQSIGAMGSVGWRIAAPAAGLVLGLVSMLVGGQPAGPAEPPIPGAPNLVLVTIDTLRRDHLGAYGSVVNTPVFDRLAAEGVVFDQAITPVPETAPSHASMMTGLHPARHRVIANGIPLRGGHRTVAEYLDATGFRTGAFVSSYAAGSSTGLQQGFQVYDDDFLPGLQGVGQGRLARLLTPLVLRFGDPAAVPWLLERPAPATIDRALAWVDAGQGPLFLWVHLFEPHSPYERHDGPSELDHRAILAQEPGYVYTADEETKLRALYRAEVEYTDTQLGVLLDGLKARKILDDALVVVVADHGESLGEHGIRFNHHGLYDDVLRVPLVLWGAGMTPSRVPNQVTVGDIANTLLERTGLPLLAETESLPLLTHTRGIEAHSSPVRLIGRNAISLTAGQLYGVRDPNGVKFISGDAGDELYALADDPGELTNLAADQPRGVEAGRKNVEQLRNLLGGIGEISTNEMLEQLGYINK